VYSLLQVEFTVHLEPGCDLSHFPACMAGGSGKNPAVSAEDKATTDAAPTTPEKDQGDRMRGYATVKVKGIARDDWR
jgi:hypothetical protein